MPTVYTPDGDVFAATVADAAALLDCSRAALYRHVRWHGDGWRLVSYPSRAKVRAGRTHHPAGPPRAVAAPRPELCACGRPRWRGAVCQPCYMRAWRARKEETR